MKKQQFRSIRSRLMFWFCFLVIFSLVTFSIVIYIQRVDDLKTREFLKLSAIRDMKAQNINAWLEKISGDIKTLAANHEVKSTGALLSSGGIKQGPQTVLLNSIFRSYLENFDYYCEFFIVGADSGKIVFSTDKSLIGEDRSNNEYYIETLNTRDIFIKGIYFSKNLNITTMTFSYPLYSAAGGTAKPFGIIVSRIFLERSLYVYLNDKTGMGKTGEIIIINKDMVALNRLRGFEGSQALFSTIRDKSTELAVSGSHGIVETLDYRGKKVLAAYTNIPRTKWGFIVKQDFDEINQPIRTMFRQIIVLLVLCIGIVSLMAFIISENLARPIKSLASVSRRIQEGDLSARHETDRVDELSYLARSFNTMADTLVSELDFQKTCSDLIEVMLSTIDLDEFSSNLLKKMVDVTGSSLGAFYILSNTRSEFKHLASIGLDVAFIETFHAGKFEGEFGKALSARKITVTSVDPENAVLRLKTVIGDYSPRELLTMPVIVNNQCVAVISLASLNVYSIKVMRILNQINLVMSAAFSNILAIEERRRLSKELEDKNRLLESKKEALQLHAYELKKQTDRIKKQNLELEEQRRIVEEANNLKSEFLSNMSHELRTPLNSILALSRVLSLQAKNKLSQEELNFVEVIQRNGKSLLTLINDILDLSKIEAGRIDLRPREINLVSILNVIIENFEQMAESKGISISMNVTGEIPPVTTDEARLYQIFQNIIGNAVKFTEEGGVAVSVSADPENVLIAVRDTGIGIAEKDLPNIFQEFRQIDGTLTRRYEGTGLGLAIAAKSAALISGTIRAESSPGIGSVFTVTVPVVWRQGSLAVPGEPNPALSFDEDFNSEYPPFGDDYKPRVLVVEDDPDNMITIKVLLQNEYEIIEAFDGMAGLDLALRELPDAILLDMALPKMSGFMVVKRIKNDARAAGIPVIAITALTMDGDRKRIIDAGCNDYISKPFDIDLFRNTVKRWVIKSYEKNISNR